MRGVVLYAALLVFLIWWSDGRGIHAQTRVAPDQIWGLSQLLIMGCSGATSPGSDCTGLMYVDLKKPDGSHITVVGTAPPSGFTIDPTKWSQLPTQ